MSVIVEGRRITSPITGSSDETDFLVDNNADVITMEIDVRFEKILMPQTILRTEFPLYFIQTKPESRFTNKPQRGDSIFTNRAEGFEANVGDTWVIKDSVTSDATGVVLQILNEGRTLILDHTFTLLETLALGAAYFAITTPITAITHKHGIIGNVEPTNYISKVDGSEQVAQLGGLSNTNSSFQTATLLGNKSWQSGSIQIKGNGIGLGDPSLEPGVVQAFTIKHTFLNNPLILADEFLDSQDGLKPDRLKDAASLRYVYSLDLAPILKNPNNTTNVISDEFIGNVGWKDENFNGGPTNYFVSDVVFENGDNTALELTTNEQKITLTIDNTIDAPFSNGNTNMIFGFNFAPASEDQYRDEKPAIDQTMEFNFMFDNVLSTVGLASGTPDKFGTVDQVIKSLTATYISDTQITVDVRLQLSTEIVSRLAVLGDKQYEIYISTANHLLLRKDSDKVTLDIDVSRFFTDVSDPTMITMVQTFMEHTGSVIGTDDKSIITARAEDDIACINSFTINKVTREADEIKLIKAEAQIVAKKADGTFFVMDSYSKNLSLESITDPTYGDIPFVDITQDRGFATPADDLRKNIRINRRTDLDSGGVFAYELIFPIVLRWEKWEPLPDANDEFFNTSLQNNGKNEDWMRISDFSGWDIYYRTTITALKNGNALVFTADKQIFTETYLVGNEWDTENQKAFIDSTNDPTLSGSDYGISLSDNTRVESNMTFIGTTPPIISDLVGVLKINVFEKGNFKDQFTASTLYPLASNTKWLNVTLSNVSGNIWRVEGVLNAELLDEETTFKITERLYDKRADAPDPPGAGKELSQGGFKEPSGVPGIKSIST